MNAPDYLQLLKLTGPELLLVLGSLAALFVDLGVMREQPRPARRLIAAGLTVLACVAAGFYLLNVEAHASIAGGMLAVDPLTQRVKLVILVLAALAAVTSVEADFTRHIGEHFALLLTATVGMLLMVSSENLLTIFLALELTGLSLYALVGLNKTRPEGVEAALKYFFFGSMAAAFSLFGMSLLFGLAGTTNLAGIAAALQGRGLDPLLAMALLLVLVGLGFKVAAVPFHLWAPDAYQGAPTPTAALIASGSKVAGFFLLARVLWLGFAGQEGRAALGGFVPGWLPVIAVLALASMLLGNLAALAQTSLKRLLAYSAVAHAGYLLVGVLPLAQSSGRAGAFAALLYYVATYGLTALGAFAVAAVAERAVGDDRIASLAGLARRSPFLALTLTVFMLSLAGLPPFAGFAGKFLLFARALQGGPAGMDWLWLVIVALLLSPVALYYYLRVLKEAYVTPPTAGAAPVRLRPAEAVVLAAAAAGVTLFGCLPQPLISFFERAITQLPH